MSESNDYTPAPWSAGRSFDTAYKQYDRNAGRSYATAKAEGKTASKLLPDAILTQSSYPLIIDTDFTGSMSGWDATIFSKMGFFLHEVKTEYFGKDAEFSFGAIADSDDEYPFQARTFAKDAAAQKLMEELVHAGGGGGSDLYHEAHGLAMLYRSRNTHMPKALIKPIYTIITDEMPHGRVSKELAKNLAKVDIEKTMSINEIVKELKAIYEVYIVLKPYGSETLVGDKLPNVTQEVYNRWEALVGADHIALLPDPNRVVDVLFGIYAKETGKIDYFREEFEKRQLFDAKGRPDPAGPAKVKTVYKSLDTIHKIAGPSSGSAPRGNTPSKTVGLGKGVPRKTD